MVLQRRILEDDIKSIASISDIIGARVKLDPVGRALKGYCPFTEHDEPTLYVFQSPETERWRCFSCSTGGDVIAFVKKWENCSHGDAVRSLAVEYGLSLPKVTPETETTQCHTSLIRARSNIIEPDLSQYTSRAQEREIRAQAYRRLIRNQRELRLCSDGLWRPNYRKDDRKLEVGKLAYKGRLNRFGTINPFNGRLPEPRPIGIVVALPTTLENHVEIELVDGRIKIEDCSEVFNAGEITWVEGEAIYKEVETKEHYPASLLGCTTAGFCLIEPLGSSPFWIPPKAPDEIGLIARTVVAYIDDARGKTACQLSLESFFVNEATDGKIPSSYTDVSGIKVPIEIPKYSPKRHADRINGI